MADYPDSRADLVALIREAREAPGMAVFSEVARWGFDNPEEFQNLISHFDSNEKTEFADRIAFAITDGKQEEPFKNSKLAKAEYPISRYLLDRIEPAENAK
ncbi:MAG: hypothetical protein AAFW81_09425 [Pseudomonadota bacterium]